MNFPALTALVLTFTTLGIPSLQAASQFYNTAVSDDWANPVWSATSGGGSPGAWTALSDAVFDQAGTYTVTLNADQSATSLNVKAGTVTFDGTNVVSSNSIVIDSGATLSGAGDRFLKVGTTSLTVNGTLDMTALGLSTRRITIAGGTGTISLTGSSGLRVGGAITFAGNIIGTGSILTDAGGTIDLSGNNTYSGDTLIRSTNVLRLGSSTALSGNTFLRFGGGTNIVELSGTDFSRNVSATAGAGNVRFNNASDGTGSAGFAAVGADRTVALNGTVSWGSTAFNPTTFQLGSAASTHKVNVTTGINLGGANRTITSVDGSASVEGEISGIISGAAGSVLTKTGTGLILLSGANTHVGGTTIAGGATQNALRISNSAALGTGTLNIGSGGNSDAARLELTGGITVTNTIAALTSRNSANPNIVNISGNNALSSNITVGGGGSQTTFRSDAGKLTFTGNFSGRTLNLQGAGDGQLSGNTTIASGNALNKSGAGVWTIGDASTDTLALNTAPVNITGGKLLLNAATTASGAINITAGTLELGASNRINSSAALTLTGGNLLTGGFSETVGILTLSGVNNIDLGGGTSILTFADSTSATWSPGSTLSILNWSGAGTDQIVFGSAGIPSGGLGAISFIDPAGFAPGNYQATLVGNELIPVPEPAAPLAALGLLLVAPRRRR
jgi:fibronectin-binding autotransporter adhesin